jgi:signal transduction histidine kinase
MDAGIGIPADQLERTKNRFFRGRNTKNIPGVGLGLHLVRVIAELHGGSLELDSEEGSGTTARVILPIRSATP